MARGGARGLLADDQPEPIRELATPMSLRPHARRGMKNYRVDGIAGLWPALARHLLVATSEAHCVVGRTVVETVARSRAPSSTQGARDRQLPAGSGDPHHR